jgi:hypothetical protein
MGVFFINTVYHLKQKCNFFFLIFEFLIFDFLIFEFLNFDYVSLRKFHELPYIDIDDHVFTIKGNRRLCNHRKRKSADYVSLCKQIEFILCLFSAFNDMKARIC